MLSQYYFVLFKESYEIINKSSTVHLDLSTNLTRGWFYFPHDLFAGLLYYLSFESVHCFFPSDTE